MIIIIIIVFHPRIYNKNREAFQGFIDEGDEKKNMVDPLEEEQRNLQKLSEERRTERRIGRQQHGGSSRTVDKRR